MITIRLGFASIVARYSSHRPPPRLPHAAYRHTTLTMITFSAASLIYFTLTDGHISAAKRYFIALYDIRRLASQNAL